MNDLNLGSEIVAKGLGSTYFVKYSTANATNFNYHLAKGKSPRISTPHCSKGAE